MATRAEYGKKWPPIRLRRYLAEWPPMVMKISHDRLRITDGEKSDLYHHRLFELMVRNSDSEEKMVQGLDENHSNSGSINHLNLRKSKSK